MRFGIRKPSIKRRIAARTSWKRAVRHNMGLKAPRGWGWFTNPKKAAYNRVYNRTSVSVDRIGRGSSCCCGLFALTIPVSLLLILLIIHLV